jgi:hypothetical protein
MTAAAAAAAVRGGDHCSGGTALVLVAVFLGGAGGLMRRASGASDAVLSNHCVRDTAVSAVAACRVLITIAFGSTHA